MLDAELLARALTLAALTAATLDYAVVVRHRVERRILAAEVQQFAESGLRGLVRVLLVDR